MTSSKRKEPAYIHIILLLIIVGLIYLLIQIAIIEPQRAVEQEEYFKQESRLRMLNLKQAEILYKEKFGKFTNNFDSLFNFLRNDEFVQSKLDSLFKKQKFGGFVIDSLRYSPKSHVEYILQIDSVAYGDSVFTKSGRFLRIDSTIVIGTKYYIECPDGYGSIGDLYNEAKLNVTSWGQ